MIPAGILSQFSGVPLNKQIWVSFNTAANDAGFYVNRYNGGFLQDLYNADQSQIFGGISSYGSLVIQDNAGAINPQVINGKYWLMGYDTEFGLSFSSSPISGTVYIFWSDAASIDYSLGMGSPQTLTIPNYPYTGTMTGTPITVTNAPFFNVFRNELTTVRFFAICIILD